MDDDDSEFDWNDKGDIENDFFTFDFQLDQLRQLRRRQVTAGRDPNFDYKYSFVSFDEHVAIAKSKGVGIAPEIKSPTAVNKVTYQLPHHFLMLASFISYSQILKSRGKNVTLEQLLLDSLAKHGYTDRDSDCLLQCFELSTLEKLKNRTNLKRLFLLKRQAKTDEATLERIKNAGIDVICTDKTLLVPRDEHGNCDLEEHDLIDKVRGSIYECNALLRWPLFVFQIHGLGMQVYAYTFKNDDLSHQCWNFYGDVRNELNQFLQLGLDGYFADYPNTVRSFLSQHSSHAVLSSSMLLVALTTLIALLH